MKVANTKNNINIEKKTIKLSNYLIRSCEDESDKEERKYFKLGKKYKRQAVKGLKQIKHQQNNNADA